MMMMMIVIIYGLKQFIKSYHTNHFSKNVKLKPLTSCCLRLWQDLTVSR